MPVNKDSLKVKLQDALDEVTTAAKNVDSDGININNPPPDQVWVDEVASAIVDFLNDAISDGEFET
jgi:hypothetical protein